jgi:hypothetical protein
MYDMGWIMAQEKNIVTVVLCTLALSACGDGSLREKVGLERKPLDEFQVLSRPPLTVPPDFNLRPPVDDAAAASNSNINNEARTLLLGDTPAAATPATTPAPSGADAVILQRTGADKAAPSVRDIIRAESGEAEDEAEKSTLDKLGKPFEKTEPLVNPSKEEQRILENKAQGKSVTDGETPTTKPKSESILDRVF